MFFGGVLFSRFRILFSISRAKLRLFFHVRERGKLIQSIKVLFFSLLRFVTFCLMKRNVVKVRFQVSGM